MTNSYILFSVLCLMTGRCWSGADATQLSDVELLLGDLFKNYSTEVRPNQNQSEVTNVSLYPFLFSVNEFDEVSGVISIVGGFSLMWHDFRLAWTPSNYGNVTTLPVPKKKIWVPDIFLINPANKMEAIGSESFLGRISYTGDVNWTPGGLIQTLCDVNMYIFPFDTQTCSFTFALWGYSEFEAVLMPFENMSSIDITYYSPNTQWKMEKTVMKYSDLLDTKNLVELQLILKRKSLYFVINMLAPILLLSLLNPIVFVLPVDSGERVSYAITIFLSFAVFMTLISEHMPKSSEPMSVLSYFLILTMTMSTLICILTVVTMRLHFKDSDLKVSKKAKVLLWILQLKFLCSACRKAKKGSEIRDISLDAGFVQSIKENKDAQNVDTEDDVTWKKIAESYDTTFLFYFFFIIFLQWISLLITIAA